jgi:hypothetical protein
MKYVPLAVNDIKVETGLEGLSDIYIHTLEYGCASMMLVRSIKTAKGPQWTIDIQGIHSVFQSKEQMMERFKFLLEKDQKGLKNIQEVMNKL